MCTLWDAHRSPTATGPVPTVLVFRFCLHVKRVIISCRADTSSAAMECFNDLLLKLQEVHEREVEGEWKRRKQRVRCKRTVSPQRPPAPLLNSSVVSFRMAGESSGAVQQEGLVSRFFPFADTSGRSCLDKRFKFSNRRVQPEEASSLSGPGRQEGRQAGPVPGHVFVHVMFNLEGSSCCNKSFSLALSHQIFVSFLHGTKQRQRGSSFETETIWSPPKQKK